ncbi:MAG: hypothetical protein WAQ33_08485 [Gaiellaceae bacterium]
MGDVTNRPVSATAKRGGTGDAPIGEAELLDRMRLVGEAFRPAAPIDRRSLFSGRSEQISELFSIAAQPGQHAVIRTSRYRFLNPLLQPYVAMRGVSEGLVRVQDLR